MKKKLLLLLIAMVTIVFAGSIITIFIDKKEGRKEYRESGISVVTSFYPTYIIALNIADQIPEVMVDSLTDFSAGCLHDYQLTTGDMKLLSSADLLLINGGGMEDYLDDVIKNYPKLIIEDISTDIKMLESYEHEGESNPHVWLDPARYMLQIANMEKSLIDYISRQESMSKETRESIIQKITDNADAYLERVSVLEEELTALLSKIEVGEEKQKVVIFHEAFAYLAERAELEVAYTVEIEGDTALSGGEIAEVIDLVKEDHIEYLFTEQQYGDSITDRIEEETDATAYIIDSAVTGDGSKDSYLKAMEKNLEILREAFQ